MKCMYISVVYFDHESVAKKASRFILGPLVSRDALEPLNHVTIALPGAGAHNRLRSKR